VSRANKACFVQECETVDRLIYGAFDHPPFKVMIARIITAALVDLVLAGHALAAQRPPADTVPARIDSLVNDFMARSHTPAVSVAVVRGPDTLVMKGYGEASVELHRPATASTVYRVGSITKQFTAAEIMRLAERGKLSIDDQVTKYLPDAPVHGRATTIRQLLNQTSGVHEYMTEPAWRANWTQPLSPQQVVAFVKHDSLDFEPGKAWEYSNTNYVLLGMIIEKVSGEAYASYLHHDLFQPLDLAQTSYCPSRPTGPTFAEGYAANVGSAGAKPTEFLDLTSYGAGSLCSTARDLLKWQRALAGGSVVNAKSYSLMTTPDTLDNGKRLTYGFGLDVGSLGPHLQIGHGGATNGFVSVIDYYPADGLNVIVLTNEDRGPDARFLGPAVRGLTINIARAMLGMPLVSLPSARSATQTKPATLGEPTSNAR
jgi:D-alanyl-D-alanine carboxypeptidase